MILFKNPLFHSHHIGDSIFLSTARENAPLPVDGQTVLLIASLPPTYSHVYKQLYNQVLEIINQVMLKVKKTKRLDILLIPNDLYNNLFFSSNTIGLPDRFNHITDFLKIKVYQKAVILTTITTDNQTAFCNKEQLDELSASRAYINHLNNLICPMTANHPNGSKINYASNRNITVSSFFSAYIDNVAQILTRHHALDKASIPYPLQTDHLSTSLAYFVDSDIPKGDRISELHSEILIQQGKDNARKETLKNHIIAGASELKINLVLSQMGKRFNLKVARINLPPAKAIEN